MSAQNYKSLLVWGLLLCPVLLCTSRAQAEFVAGTNTALDAQGGKHYIPLTSWYSGDVKNGSGRTSDRTMLRGLNDKAMGWTTMTLEFNLTGALPDDYVIDPNKAEIEFNLFDVDFVPQIIANRVLLYEKLFITFLSGPGEEPVHQTFVLDAENWDKYVFGTAKATNNTEVTYYLSLRDQLNVTDEDFENINLNKKFALLLGFETHMEHMHPDKTLMINTPEKVFTSFSFVADPIPEPGVIGLILAGVPLVITKRRVA